MLESRYVRTKRRYVYATINGFGFERQRNEAVCFGRESWGKRASHFRRRKRGRLIRGRRARRENRNVRAGKEHN